MRVRAAVTAIAFVGIVGAVAPAAAAAAGGAPTQLRISGPQGTVTLTCGLNAPGGTHPYPREACAEIDAANGNIAAIPPMPGVGCTGLWDPVAIGATGTWQGMPVRFSDIESNAGCARISHGHVFFF